MVRMVTWNLVAFPGEKVQRRTTCRLVVWFGRGEGAERIFNCVAGKGDGFE